MLLVTEIHEQFIQTFRGKLCHFLTPFSLFLLQIRRVPQCSVAEELFIIISPLSDEIVPTGEII